MSDNTMPERIAPIELIAHGDGWRNVEYIRADVAQAEIAALRDEVVEARRHDARQLNEIELMQAKIVELETDLDAITCKLAHIAQLEAALRHIAACR